MSNGKVMITLLIAEFIGKIYFRYYQIILSQHFPERYIIFGKTVKIKLGISNYTTKSNVKQHPVLIL